MMKIVAKTKIQERSSQDKNKRFKRVITMWLLKIEEDVKFIINKRWERCIIHDKIILQYISKTQGFQDFQN